jgi:2,4-dienoyl-CoA reductase-like NADH-dependent reductase (Old Yellow Enzyme family)/thioredoxin reductase
MIESPQVKLRKLFTPLNHDKITLKNRIMQMAMLTRFCDDKGHMTDRYIDFMAARAKGGTALLTSEATYLTADSRYRPNQMAVYDDSYIPGMKKLVDAVHQFDCKITLQVMHAGTRLSESYLPGSKPVGPSAVPHIPTGIVPHELTEKEIEVLVDAFGKAAERGLRADFDGVEIHGSHAYLITQFCSPFYNKRNDKYGGTPQRRARFAVEIARRIRDYCGPDYPIFYRLQADDFVAGGIQVEEAKIHAQMLEEAGIDFLNVTGGNREGIDMQIQPSIYPRGCLLHLTRAIRPIVNIPIVAVGRIVDPFQAEAILDEGIADIIGMARAHLADPEFANKAAEGRYEDINQCIGCMLGCIDKDLKRRVAVTCAVNPACGWEGDFVIVPSRGKKKKVVVVGGGPAGMSCARVAAERRHEVILYEREDRLGGQVLVGSAPKGKDELLKVPRWYEHQFRKLGVKVFLNTEATPSMVGELKPDVIVLAQGAEPIIPDARGIYRENVVRAIDVLNGNSEVGDRVVVVGGGMVGIETAEYLAEKGKKVAIVEMLPKIGLDLGLTQRLAHWRRIPQLDIKIYTDARLWEVFENGINVIMKVELEHEERKGEEVVFVPADTVVVAVGQMPVKGPVDEWKKRAGQVFEVGDCVEPLRIVDAIHDGARLGLKI